MARRRERGHIALIILGALVLLAGIAAFVMVQQNMVNSAEEGTAKKVGGGCLAAGLVLVVVGVMNRRKP